VPVRSGNAVSVDAEAAKPGARMDELDSALSLCAAIQQDKEPEAYRLNRGTIMSMVNATCRRIAPGRSRSWPRESGWRTRCASWPRAARHSSRPSGEFWDTGGSTIFAM
jgi:hypothetical protein